MEKKIKVKKEYLLKVSMIFLIGKLNMVYYIKEVFAKDCVELEYFGEYWEGMWEYCNFK